ncbi:MAG: transposase [Roseburia sp.]
MRGNAISEQEYQEIVEAEKRTKDKRVSKKLRILLLRFSGKSIAETAEQMNCSVSTVRRSIAEYHRDGLVEYMRSKYAGNHRSLSVEEENAILSSFEKKADAGQVITVQDIKRVFDERIGKDTGRGYIYMLLKRHGWRKVMPRARHPKKADDEAIEASKKLKTT